MRSLAFWKWEGTGNDFVLISLWDEEQAEWRNELPALAQRLCARPRGIGADGLLVVSRGEHAPVRMRMFNPDGTEDFCGNGLRCCARFAYEQGYVATPQFEIETLGGRCVPVQLHLQAGKVERVSVILPPPRFHPRDIPALVEGEVIDDYPLTIGGQTLRINSVNTGTTHTVIFTDRLPDDALFLQISPRLETHPLFPERTSVLWAVVESPERLRVRIWERGVGETLGCGSGACAVAVLAQRAGWVGRRVEIHSKGGILEVEPLPAEGIKLTGDASCHFEGVFYLE